MTGISALVDTRQEFDDLWGLYLPIGVAVAAIIFALVGFSLVRYRRRSADHWGSRRSELPVVEGLYAVGLAAIVALLASQTFRTTDTVDAVAADPGTEIEVVAFQWGWRFNYPQGVSVVGDDRDPPTLTVPSDTTIRFKLRSRDVIHAFWIPELRFKRDAFPKRRTEFDLAFVGDDVARGTVGRCAEFCGLLHADMTFEIVVLPPAEFEDWLKTRRSAKRSADRA